MNDVGLFADDEDTCCSVPRFACGRHASRLSRCLHGPLYVPIIIIIITVNLYSAVFFVKEPQTCCMC